MDIPPLTHEDLIITSEVVRKNQIRTVYGYWYPEVLRPRHILVHPSVLEQPFAYLKEFVDQVMERVPELLKRDVETIERKLRVNLRVVIKPEGVLSENGVFLFNNVVRCIPRPNGIQLGSAEMVVNPHDSKCISEDILVPAHVLAAYTVPGQRNPNLFAWSTHNITYQGFGFELFARNYAIGFNNLGLEQLARCVK